MIILNEHLGQEADEVADKLNETYGFSPWIDCKTHDFFDKFLTCVQRPTDLPKGILSTSLELRRKLKDEYGKDKKVLVLTQRDIFDSDNPNHVDFDEDWLFSFSFGKLSMISTARLKRPDNKPSNELQVSEDLYMKRLQALAVGEIGLGFIHNPAHFKDAIWVNTTKGNRLKLGPSCTNNSCAMYGVVDIKAPHADEGYMLLGKEKRYDAGLDNLLERLGDRPDWLCKRCRDSVKVGKEYL